MCEGQALEGGAPPVALVAVARRGHKNGPSCCVHAKDDSRHQALGLRMQCGKAMMGQRALPLALAAVREEEA